MNKKNQNAPVILGIFFVVTLVSAGVIYYFAGDNQGPGISMIGNLRGYFATHRADHGSPSPALASFSSLDDDYKKGGLEKFQAKKEELRSEVESVLKKDDDSPDHDKAENIAVYMFPDLLDKEDFERDVAMENWYSQENKIEQDPKSPESRREFEDLKNNVWNYENPDRGQPTVSDYAAQVIRIYDAMTRGEN